MRVPTSSDAFLGYPFRRRRQRIIYFGDVFRRAHERQHSRDDMGSPGVREDHHQGCQRKAREPIRLPLPRRSGQDPFQIPQGGDREGRDLHGPRRMGLVGR